MTPRLLHLTFAAEAKIAERAHHTRAWLAWQTASLTGFAFHKPSAMPKLETLTGQKPKITVQTPDQMKAAFAEWRTAAR